MKKASLKKVLFLPVIAGGLLLTLNPSSVEATQDRSAMIDTYNTIVQPQARIMAASNGVTTPSIQQTGITVVAGRGRTISSEIANYRTYYGAGEKIEIQVKFTKAINNINNAQLVIKFGESGAEKVVSSPTKSNDVMTFSYTIEEEDQGGIILQNLTGTVTDAENNSCDLAIPVGSNNTFSNTIQAKGKWEINGNQAGSICFAQTMGETTTGSAAYVFDEKTNKIRPMKKSDVYKLNTTTGTVSAYAENTEDITFTELDENEKGVKRLTYPNETIIYIPNACDIAGNKRGISNVSKTQIYTVYAKSDKAVNSDGFTYLKAGDKVTLTAIGYWPDGNAGKIKFGFKMTDDSNTTLTGAKFFDTETGNGTGFDKAKTDIAEGIVQIEYTVQQGDNGRFRAYKMDKSKTDPNAENKNCFICEKDGGTKILKTESEAPTDETGVMDVTGRQIKFESKFIADTIAPEVMWDSMDLVETGEEKYGWLQQGVFKEIENGGAITNKEDYKGSSSKIAKDSKNNKDAILYLNDGKPEFQYIVTDTNNSEDMPTFMNLGKLGINTGNNDETAWVGFKDKTEYGKNLEKLKTYNEELCTVDHEVTVKDKAGNEGKASTWQQGLKMIVDWKKPTVNIKNKRNDNGTIEFEITSEDPSGRYNSEQYNGSGVAGSIDIEKIKIQNGTIIKSESKYDDSSDKGNGKDITTVTVMPAVDGYVSLVVLEGAVKDHCDNTNEMSEISKIVADRTPPVIHDVTGVPTDWVDKATISVVASDAGVGELKYCFAKVNELGNGVEQLWNGNEWKNVSSWYPGSSEDGYFTTNNTCVINENGVYLIFVRDLLNNMTNKKIEITKIDSSNPTFSDITKTPNTEWANQDVTVTIHASDAESGVAMYSFDGGSNWQTSPSKTYSETTSISGNMIKVKDRAGKETVYNTGVEIKIDKTKPTISTSINPTGDTEGNVTLTITPTDEGGSGIASVTVNGENITATNNSYQKTITSNGDYTITVRDHAGNETTKVQTISNIKKFEPVITFENAGNTYVRPTDGGKTKIKTAIDVRGENGVSIEYALTASQTAPTNWTNAGTANRVDMNAEVSEAGTYYLHAKVTKNNITRTATSQTFKVVESTITLNSVLNATKQSATVTANYGEGLTENRKFGVGNNMSSNTNTITLTENGKVHAEATDIAGNRVYADLQVNDIVQIIQPQIEQGSDKYIKNVITKGDKNYIIVNPTTTAEQLKTNVITDYAKTVENTVEQGQLKTGSTLKIGTVNSEYIIVVKGDADCDGKVDFKDVVRMNSIRLNKIAIANVSYQEQLASDVDGNGKIEFSDIVKVNSYRLGKTNTL